MKWLYDVWDDFSGLLFPRLCYGCGNHLTRNEYLICTVCQIEIPRTDYHLRRDNPVEQLLWGRCMVEKAAVFSFYTRGSRIRSLIHSLKYKGIKEVGTELGRIYGSTLGEAGYLDGIDCIIPVPLHPSKERSRGFNQSRIIAEGMSSVTGIPVEDKALVRISKTQTQTRRSRYARWSNVEGIFAVAAPDLITKRHLLLLDDVITTGSTIEACVKELSGVNGVKISVVALACAVM